MPTPESIAPPDFPAYRPPESALMEKFNVFDRAAKKDLHWWFFALLMIGMGYVGFERWEFGRREDSLRGEITEVRNAQLQYVTSKSEAMMSALLNNTRALEANTQTLNRMERNK